MIPDTTTHNLAHREGVEKLFAAFHTTTQLHKVTGFGYAEINRWRWQGTIPKRLIPILLANPAVINKGISLKDLDLTAHVLQSRNSG